MDDLKTQIAWYLYIQYRNDPTQWITKADLIDKKEWKYIERTIPKVAMSDTVSRKARLAEQQKLIAQKDDPDSKSILYKWLPPQLKARYIPYSERSDKAIILRP